jgi:FkbM family methyltransferase
MPARRLFYRIPPLAKFLRTSLNRAAPAGLTEVVIAAGGLEGIRFCLDLQSEKDYWLGTYEPELQSAINDWIQPGKVAYDVGANIGYISLLLARRLGQGGRVFAFEALPSNRERLQANLELSGYADYISLIPAAVLDRSQPARFLVGPSGGMGKAEGSAGRVEFNYRTSIEVEGISLDDFVYRDGNLPPQAVKMDIEGGEVLALPGMLRILKEIRPIVLMELHGPESAQVAWQTFSQAGYDLRRMVKGYPEINSFEELEWKAYLVAVG